MIHTDTGHYKVVRTALDGSRLSWQMSPIFRPKRVEPVVPEPVPAVAATTATPAQPGEAPAPEQEPVESSANETTEEETPVIHTEEEVGAQPAVDEFNLVDQFERMRTGPVAADPPAPVAPAE